MPGAISNSTKDKIVLIIVAVGVLITLFAMNTEGTFR